MEEPGYNSGFDVDEFLEHSQIQERQRLEKESERIERQLDRRDQVHDEIVEELESQLDWYIDRLEKLYKQMRGKDGEREHLKSRIDEFYMELRKEKRDCWMDKVDLEKELREVKQELKELEDGESLYGRLL